MQWVEVSLLEALRHEHFMSLGELWEPCGPRLLSGRRTSTRSIAVPIRSSLQAEAQLTRA